jgi:fructose 1,6-bisphosphate aldolase/phosphatase
MITLSIIKADTGGYVGHSSVHPRMVEVAQTGVDRAKGELLIDGQIA